MSEGGPDQGWGAPPPGPYGGGGGYPPPQPGWGTPGPYGAPGAPPPGWSPVPVGPPRTHGKAIAVLVLGIASLIACLGLPGIVALCLAPGARREIAASQGRLTGEGLVKAGVICSWISIALAILVIIAFAIVLAFAISNGSGSIEIRTPEPALEF